MNYDSYPDYLYDNSYINDIEYLLSLDNFVLSISNIVKTIKGTESTSFDEYSNWSKSYPIGKQITLSTYTRKPKLENPSIEEIDFYTISDNLNQNILSLAKENPNTEFYLFLTPYSILYFDDLNQKNELEAKFIEEQYAIELLLSCDNIHLFSFFDDFELITNLDNYKDTTHYGEHINSYILKCMKEGKHQLTKENYKEYLEKEKDFYLSYDYDQIFR